MQREYTTPSGNFSRLYADMLNQINLLIAGCVGSGKSTVVNGIMHAALYRAPCDVGFILIDPKGCELDEYRGLPHTITYAESIPDCVKALECARNIVNARKAEMKRRKLRMYDGSDIYIVIDEMMYLFNQRQYKREAMALLQDILTIARACKVHVIACTQSPTSQTGLPVNLRCNFDSRLGLRTSTAQDGRNIIGVRGCEQFPNPQIAHTAYGYYMRGGEMDLYKLPRIEDDDRQRLIDYWTGRQGRGRLKLFKR